MDAVIVTHAHGDHCHGIDELRPVAAALGGPVPLHARRSVLDELEERFAYAFDQSAFYRPILEPRVIERDLALGEAAIRFVDQPHGDISSLGLRFDEGGRSVVYSIDFSELTDEMAALYEGADVWIADCLMRRPHPTHAHLEGVLGVGEGPSRRAGLSDAHGQRPGLPHSGRRTARLGSAGARRARGRLMMTNDLMLGGLYLLMAIMLVLGTLMSRREPAAKLITMALAWIAIFGGGFILFTFRDDFGWVAQRLRAEAVGTPVLQGRETRIPMAIDGHFWVEGRLNGKRVKFLVDSGATMTTVDRDTALKAGVPVSSQRDQFVRTGNGIIRVSSGRAAELQVGRDRSPRYRRSSRRQRRSQRAGDEFPVVSEPLGGRGTVAGAGSLMCLSFLCDFT